MNAVSSLVHDAEELTLLRAAYPKYPCEKIGYAGHPWGPIFVGMPTIRDLLPYPVPVNHPADLRVRCLFDPECRREPRLAWDLFLEGRDEPPVRFGLGPLTFDWVRQARRGGHVALLHASGACLLVCVHQPSVEQTLRAFTRAARLYLRVQGYNPIRLSEADIEALR